ncbi:ATP-binding cassette domain-containing protein [Nocardioides sp. MAH-18]|uniref:ATP-binding cassette domain-containing protein n=1 Tax=Nocardioides agri TaxID=2682843 RepID=A0A6L6XYZ2_9ACTN|nr:MULTISPECIES: ATP-binding cassette domain-containing protein [unclassified Nocardioides]MBA2952464.1 ATP-binding cassette domain-containing protein [Nocardioides sp. CGMCC 1.13656]MVQ51626.1 ATP-binding cassette domain-containing protein [Nocardioides sp. MAH-18]
MTTATTVPAEPAGLRVTTHGLVHIYRSEGHEVAALSGVDLEVGAGEMVGLLGPSGAGKSTLLSLLAGVFRPSAGKVFVGATELSAATPRELDALRARRVSLMLQGAGRNLLPYLTPMENVRFAQRTARRSGRGVELPEPVDVLAGVGLEREVDRPLAELSPGHLQLAALAVAMAARPGLLLADEPTSQLEHAARDLVLERMATLNRDLGTTVVLVTHDPDVASFLPRTITIRDGRVGGEGRSGEEFAVVTPDGFLPLPPHVREDLLPGTLVRFHLVDGQYLLLPETGGAEGVSDV